jgi:hypothetical protein
LSCCFLIWSNLVLLAFCVFRFGACMD